MTSKSLYDKFRYSPEGEEMDKEADKIIEPIFDKYVSLGFCPREISHLLLLTVFRHEVYSVVRFRQKNKEKRK